MLRDFRAFTVSTFLPGLGTSVPQVPLPDVRWVAAVGSVVVAGAGWYGRGGRTCAELGPITGGTRYQGYSHQCWDQSLPGGRGTSATKDIHCQEGIRHIRTSGRAYIADDSREVREWRESW